MRKNVAVLFAIFCLMWYFNLCTPLIFDDYVYSFVWQDNAMGVAFTETIKRVSGVTDIINSQWKHYFSWGGRTVAHFLAQLFLWLGKDMFNFLNAGCFLLLLLEMQWVIHGGKISLNFSFKDILWSFGAIWIFTIYLGDVFTWVTLSCNYLWTTVIMLAFLLVYERHYLCSEHKFYERSHFCSVLFFLFGVIAGWTNENVPGFVIVILGWYLLKFYKNQKEINLLLFSGLFGLTLGYILLMSAPGNYMRYVRQVQDNIVVPGVSLVRENIIVLSKILCIRLIMIYYVVRNLFIIKEAKASNYLQKLLNVSWAFLLLSLASLVIMIFSPLFRYRSSFPGLIFLILAVGIVKRVRTLEEKHVMDKVERKKTFESKTTKVLHIMGIFYICVTLTASLYIATMQYKQTQVMLSEIHNAKQLQSNKVLTVLERPKVINKNFFEAFMFSGGHLIYPYSLTSDENCWINKDVALYYGIPAIRSEKEEGKP